MENPFPWLESFEISFGFDYGEKNYQVKNESITSILRSNFHKAENELQADFDFFNLWRIWKVVGKFSSKSPFSKKNYLETFRDAGSLSDLSVSPISFFPFIFANGLSSEFMKLWYAIIKAGWGLDLICGCNCVLKYFCEQKIEKNLCIRAVKDDGTENFIKV